MMPAKHEPIKLSLLAVFAFTLFVIILRHAHVDHVLESSGSWANNQFSSATSGKVFRMQAWRRYKGTRAFAKWTAGVSSQPLSRPPDCHTWAVVTTISSPTVAVKQLAKLANDGKLCLVVVGDEKTPTFNDLGKNTVYLSPDDQRKLPYKSMKHLPWNHFGRKNVGYLYAIAHGALRVYDTDDDNELKDLDIPAFTQDQFGLLQTNLTLSNPNPCFYMQSSPGDSNLVIAWPRGFPLKAINSPQNRVCTMRNVSEREFDSIAIIQSLANHDPDVDAIFRLTRPLPLNFGAPGLDGKHAMVLPAGTFTPYNAQATLYKRSAMWGLLLPITVHGRVSDIWRSYFTQAVMWRAGLALAMSQPWVVQKRNAHNYLGDFHAESDLYYQSGALVHFLARQYRDSTQPIPTLVEKVYIDMYEHGIIEAVDVSLVQAWLKDLEYFGYKFPDVMAM